MSFEREDKKIYQVAGLVVLAQVVVVSFLLWALVKIVPALVRMIDRVAT